MKNPGSNNAVGHEVAVIGVAGRFPGAGNVWQFWQNLCDGVESIRRFTSSELEADGVPRHEIEDPRYVPARGALDDVAGFDAEFFEVNPREAQLLDPQHRHFLECAWSAFEDAGYAPRQLGCSVGVFASAGPNTYYLSRLLKAPEVLSTAGELTTLLAGDKDFLPTRVSYKLDLRGPSVGVQTACSSSLTAVCLGCQSLSAGECDMALCGGVSIRVPTRAGYRHQNGGILSPDGHCRPFDAGAAGTVPGDGVAAVVLKRLADAVRDRDSIYAIIRGYALNNDGCRKAGYTAPSVDAQADVVRRAQLVAGVDARSVTFVEAHGTGTRLGDAVELTGLTIAFGPAAEPGGCVIGSVKSNVGHLDCAAGIAGLIKATLTLRHRMIPPTLHFERSNAEIDLSRTPFRVNTSLCEWPAPSGQPRRAGVSSFGIGGTNAHVLLEEAPAPEATRPADTGRPRQILMLSAKSATSLRRKAQELSQHLSRHPNQPLPDIAYTLRAGREAMRHRRYCVCRNGEDGAAQLAEPDGRRTADVGDSGATAALPVAMMFPGQAAQYPTMGYAFYLHEPVFREHVDHCCQLVSEQLGSDPRDLLYPPAGRAKEAAEALRETELAQAALFVTEFALAQLWLGWGVAGAAYIGHSFGEYVVACLCGVMSLEDVIFIISERARLMQRLPAGKMLAARLSPARVNSYLSEQVSLAAINGPRDVVLSGDPTAIDAVRERCAHEAVACRELPVNRAFHSQMLDQILDLYELSVRRVTLRPPRQRYISSLTGTWVTPEQCTDPHYWAMQLRQTVRFSDGVRTLRRDGIDVFVEVGPGRALSSYACQADPELDPPTTIPCLFRANEPCGEESELDTLYNALGTLWIRGTSVEPRRFAADEVRSRVSVPAYPFEHVRHWVDVDASGVPSPVLDRQSQTSEWLFIPRWTQCGCAGAAAETSGNQDWLLFEDHFGLCAEIERQLKRRGHRITVVTAGEGFQQISEFRFVVSPQDEEHYARLFGVLKHQGRLPQRIVQAWSLSRGSVGCAESGESPQKWFDLGFYSLLSLGRALSAYRPEAPVRLLVLCNRVHDVLGGEVVLPEKATILGPCRVIPQEIPQVDCRHVDVACDSVRTDYLAARLIAELARDDTAVAVAYRGLNRWVQEFRSCARTQEGLQIDGRSAVKVGGVYLVVGGLGGVGLSIAKAISRTPGVKLALLGRTPRRNEGPSTGTSLPAEVDSLQRHRESTIAAIEATGAQILAVAADVADPVQMRRAVRQIVECLGPIRGVIHAAGVPGAGLIQTRDRQTTERHWAAKIRGIRVLEQVLTGQPIDFVVLCSSIGSLLGGVGTVDYAAANAFLDAYAHSRSACGAPRVLSINWDAWAEVGMAANAAIPEDLRDLWREGMAHSIHPEQAEELFPRLLSIPAPQIVVSTRDFPEVVRLAKQLPGLGPIDAATRRGIQRQKLSSRANRHSYVPPADDIELALATLWSECFGIQDIGLTDNFFDLGGHSLLAVQLLANLQKRFSVDLPLGALFEAPTLGGMAARLRAILWVSSRNGASGTCDLSEPETETL